MCIGHVQIALELGPDHDRLHRAVQGEVGGARGTARSVQPSLGGVPQGVSVVDGLCNRTVGAMEKRPKKKSSCKQTYT